MPISPLNNTPAKAFNRANADSRRALKFAYGTTTVADTNPLTVQTGLKAVLAVTATANGATATAAAVTRPGGGAITIEGAAAGTFDWIALGY